MAKCSTRKMSAYKPKLKNLRIVAIELEILKHIFKLSNSIVPNLRYSSDSAEQAAHLQ